MLPETLVALACLIANKGPVDTATLEAQLSEDERAQVQAVVNSDACLPENMEKLLKNTDNQIKDGQIKPMGAGNPSFGGGKTVN